MKKRIMIGIIVVVLLVVDDIHGILCMQFAVATVVIVDAVGDVGSFLNFYNSSASAHSMYASGRDKVELTCLHILVLEQIFEVAVLN